MLLSKRNQQQQVNIQSLSIWLANFDAIIALILMTYMAHLDAYRLHWGDDKSSINDFIDEC